MVMTTHARPYTIKGQIVSCPPMDLRLTPTRRATATQTTPAQTASINKMPKPECIREKPTICGPRSHDQTVCSQARRAARRTLKPATTMPIDWSQPGNTRAMTPNVVLCGGPQMSFDDGQRYRPVRSSYGLEVFCSCSRYFFSLAYHTQIP